MPDRALLLVPSARWLLAGGVLTAVAAIVAATLARDDARPAEAPALALDAREPVVAVREVAPEAEAPEAEEPEPEEADPLASIQPMDPIEDPADFTFVVEIGGTSYIRIARGEDVGVEGARDDAELYHDDLVTSAVAPLADGELPEELRRWRGRRVLVDGTCAAKVIAFAEIGRVSGDAHVVSADEDRIGAAWTVESAFEHGRTMIAGELDGSCAGSWARAADRPAVGRAIAIDDPRLASAAQRAFLASPHAELIADGWREAKQEGDWHDQVTLDARIFEHSATHARWVYVHARKPGGCGDHDVNVAATYQVRDDGTLAEIETDGLPGGALEDLVDLNGDGWFERVVVQEDEADHSLVGPADSTELSAIDVPFHGCPC